MLYPHTDIRHKQIDITFRKPERNTDPGAKKPQGVILNLENVEPRTDLTPRGCEYKNLNVNSIFKNHFHLKQLNERYKNTVGSHQ